MDAEENNLQCGHSLHMQEVDPLLQDGKEDCRG